MKKKGRFSIVICGYYGFGNLGDEAILEVMCEALKKSFPDCRICVLSKNPKKTRNLLVKSVHRYNLPVLIYKMLTSHLYISGGGGLLQNSTSRRSLWYYSIMMLLGRLLCGRLILFANGVGELLGNCRLLKYALSHADYISVRGENSRKRLLRFGIDTEQIAVCADPVFVNTDKNHEQKAEFAISVINNESDYKEIIRFCKEKSDLTPVFVAMAEEDIPVCKSLWKLCGGKVVYPRDYGELLDIMSYMQFAIGMRLHFLYAAAICKTPVVVIKHNLKTEDFACLFNHGVMAGNFSEKELSEAVDVAISDKTERLSALRKKSKEGIEGLCQAVSEIMEEKQNRENIETVTD